METLALIVRPSVGWSVFPNRAEQIFVFIMNTIKITDLKQLLPEPVESRMFLTALAVSFVVRRQSTQSIAHNRINTNNRIFIINILEMAKSD